MPLLTYVLLTMCPFHQTVKICSKQFQLLFTILPYLFCIWPFVCPCGLSIFQLNSLLVIKMDSLLISHFICSSKRTSVSGELQLQWHYSGCISMNLCYFRLRNDFCKVLIPGSGNYIYGKQDYKSHTKVIVIWRTSFSLYNYDWCRWWYN